MIEYKFFELLIYYKLDVNEVNKLAINLLKKDNFFVELIKDKSKLYAYNSAKFTAIRLIKNGNLHEKIRTKIKLTNQL